MRRADEEARRGEHDESRSRGDALPLYRGRAGWHCGIVSLPWIVSSLELDNFRIDGGDGRDVGFGLGP